MDEPDLNINLIEQDLPKESLLPDSQKDKVLKACNTTYKNVRCLIQPPDNCQSLEVNIIMTSDQVIRELNKTYRQKDTSTNVLSFAYLETSEKDSNEPACSFGDIIISIETIGRQAKDTQKPFHDHLIHISVHAMLHIMGYDHQTNKQAENMEAQEVKILKMLGINDPYHYYDHN